MRALVTDARHNPNTALEALRERFGGRRVTVVGLARSGRAAARLLLSAGARVTATDLRPLRQLGPEADILQRAGVTMALGQHPDAVFDEADAIVLSPGVDTKRLPGIERARARGAEVLAEVDLVAAQLAERLVGITGSNGKSTTTALTTAMLAAAGFDALACGNYGLPLTDAAQGDSPERRYVAELSSFQLEAAQELRVAASVILNIVADHLDRHGSLEAYAQAKFRLAGMRLDHAPLIVNVDDPLVAEWADRIDGPRWHVSLDQPVEEGGFVRDGKLMVRLKQTETALASIDELSLVGRHNLTNVLCAALAAHALGVGFADIRRASREFRSLPHRLEEVARVRGVRFINDSKATNVAACVAAIVAFEGTVGDGRLIVLLGGRDKDSPFDRLAGPLSKAGATVIAFGEAKGKIASALEPALGGSLQRAATMAEAVRAGFAAAASGDVMLLSPACASFDEFDSFEHRGRAFADLARELAAEDGR